jgi:Zn-dependent M28 family amino/carboxypeptidase
MKTFNSPARAGRYLVLVAPLLLAGCSRTAEAPTATSGAPATPASTAATKLPLDKLPKVSADAMLAHIKVLASDEYEGRLPGTPGEAKTVEYITQQFQTLGLKPGNTDGTFIQKMPLVGITGTEAKPLIVGRENMRAGFKWKNDVVAWTKHVADDARIENSDLVFAGYGVVAPEYNWDDFKGVDVKGKTIVVLVNDPQIPDPADPSKLDSRTFNGAAMTYYGRWTYKYEEAARRGAAGVFIVHEEGPAGYPYSVVQGFLAERFSLVSPDNNMGRASLEGWLSLDAAKRLLKLAGQDFAALKKQATTREFKPVPLGLKASMTVKNTRRTIESRNVLARLEGSDATLKDDYVVYSAHWDHLGLVDPDKSGDKIANGALDNASGVAQVLEIARAFTQVQPPPKRSILFLMVTAEEQGLLGSEFYAVNPPYPLTKTAANINVDGFNQWGRTKDITVIGLGASDLDDYLRDAAAEQSRTLRPDPEAEKGFYYRSDHFNFAKQGVPALYTDSGVEYIDKPAGYSQQKRDEYTKVDYHQPSDQIKPDWDLAGAVDDAHLLLAVGYRVANADKFPEWKPGNEFRAKREEMLRKK